MKTIGITGGTGFVGHHLSKLLISKGYHVVIFTRGSRLQQPGEQISYAHWDAKKGVCDIKALNSLDGILHLAGAGVADKRLTEARKKEIVDSRVDGTNFLVEQLRNHSPNCKTIIAASATGYYGPDTPGKIPFTETAPCYTDFLGSTCQAWENATNKASDFLRTVIIRTGIVLGKEHGAFPKFAMPLSFGVMPILGSGKQIVPWIEIEDLARLFIHLLEHEQLKGVYNGVSPNPVSYRELVQTIAKVKGGIKLPVPVPAFALKIALGELSEEVLKSCTVSAKKTMDSGFVFAQPEITGAVKAILAA